MASERSRSLRPDYSHEHEVGYSYTSSPAVSATSPPLSAPLSPLSAAVPAPGVGALAALPYETGAQLGDAPREVCVEIPIGGFVCVYR